MNLKHRNYLIFSFNANIPPPTLPRSLLHFMERLCYEMREWISIKSDTYLCTWSLNANCSIFHSVPINVILVHKLHFLWYVFLRLFEFSLRIKWMHVRDNRKVSFFCKIYCLHSSQLPLNLCKYLHPKNVI